MFPNYEIMLIPYVHAYFLMLIPYLYLVRDINSLFMCSLLYF